MMALSLTPRELPPSIREAGGALVDLVEASGGLYALAGSERRQSWLLRESSDQGLEQVACPALDRAGPSAQLSRLDDGTLALQTRAALHLRGVSGWKLVALPADASAVWGTDPRNLYAIAEKRLLWYDGNSWRPVSIADRFGLQPTTGRGDEAQYCAGHGVAGLQVVVGTHGTHSCMAVGERDLWSEDGCGSWYLYAVQVFATDHAVAVGGDGIWEFRGSDWEALLEHKCKPAPAHLLGCHRHQTLLGVIEGTTLKVREGRRAAYRIDLDGFDPKTISARERPIQPTSLLQMLDVMIGRATNKEADAAPPSLPARWLPSGRLVLVDARRLWVSETVARLADVADEVHHLVEAPRDDMLLVSIGQGNSDAAGSRARRSAFWIDRLPVTNRDYAAFLAATGAVPPAHWSEGEMPPGREDHPVVGVSYADAVSFAAWAGKRLPTEEEWERAARGTDERRYPWGDEPPPWYEAQRFELPARLRTRSVGLPLVSNKSASGLEDIGQVWEWTASIDELHDARVVRGGPWRDRTDYPEVTNRSWESEAALDVGFRCARDASPITTKVRTLTD